jgi:hypothetical protein
MLPRESRRQIVLNQFGTWILGAQLVLLACGVGKAKAQNRRVRCPRYGSTLECGAADPRDQPKVARTSGWHSPTPLVAGPTPHEHHDSFDDPPFSDAAATLGWTIPKASTFYDFVSKFPAIDHEAHDFVAKVMAAILHKEWSSAGHPSDESGRTSRRLGSRRQECANGGIRCAVRT